MRHKREVYDRGNGATILLYNAKKKTVVLIRQFRVATWVNGNESGQLIETCAGLLDNDEPEGAFAKKRLKRRAMKLAKSANYLTVYVARRCSELIHFFIAEYRQPALTPVVVSKMKILKCLSCRSARRWR
ncbi:MAG: hypothetical protein ACLRXB_12155 [Escherichia coli]